MLSINTNISTFITQNSLKKSTDILNQAVERMTTGYKINHAKDNAANYSISTNMTTKIGAYQVAEDNVSMGLDMLTTASESLSQIENKLSRLRSLAVQSSNGTYGAESLKAINSEANAITDEIERLFKTAEYNGIELFDNEKTSLTGDMPKAGAEGFIKQVQKQDTSLLTKLSTVSSSSDLADGTYSISTANELAQLAKMTNDGFISEGDTFVLANDIDLAQWCADHAGDGGWTPIGDNTNKFLGTFDGNGYKISNLKINRSGESFQSLFGRTDGNAIIKNLGVTNVDITSDVNCTGAIVGGVISGSNTMIDNCYSSGEIYGGAYTGGIVGQGGNISNSYSTCNIKSTANYVGGLVGMLIPNSTVNNCFSKGVVETLGYNCGGLIGVVKSGGIITNCYATGNLITASYNSGGLIGSLQENANITNCYATGNLTTASYNSGGLVGLSQENANITNCYAMGNVTSTATDYTQAGGLIGRFCGGSIADSYATGSVQGIAFWVGGFVGLNSSTGDTIIENCYSTGDVKGDTCVGGFIGGNESGVLSVMSSYSTGNVKGEFRIGGFIGYTKNGSNSFFENCYATGSVFGNANVGGFAGDLESGSASVFENCYTKSAVANGSGFIGYAGGLTPSVTLRNCSVLGTIEDGVVILLACNIDTSLDTITIENCQYNSQLISSNLPLVVNLNSLDITNNTVRNAVSTCGFITPFDFSNDINISLQVGIDSSQNSQISMKTNFSLDYLNITRQIGRSNADIFKAIDFMLETVSAKQVELGSIQNRLDSALDEISTQYENLVSSRSTIRDADIAEVSSTYIQQQILQQASATLMATANQNPAIALQLI